MCIINPIAHNPRDSDVVWTQVGPMNFQSDAPGNAAGSGGHSQHFEMFSTFALTPCLYIILILPHTTYSAIN